jgi:hypothetical protein
MQGVEIKRKDLRHSGYKEFMVMEGKNLKEETTRINS